MKEKLETITLFAVSVAAAVYCLLTAQTPAAILFTVAATVTGLVAIVSAVFAAVRRKRS